VRSSKLEKQSQSTHREGALREQLQACFNEQEVLAQQHQLLLVERDQLYWTLMQVMVTDAITGLPNHQAVINRLEEEVVGYQQTPGSCALLFVDLDHFKRVNDTWGHRAGDGLLHEIAQRVRTVLRPQDFVGRYGGEEFLILLPGVDVPAAIQTAEYLRSLISSHSCFWQPNHGSAAVSISTTVSIGVAIYPLHGTSADTLLEVADRAMYRAKYTGRNRVYLADMEMASPQSLHDEKEYLAVQALTAAASVHDGGTQAHAQRLVHLIEATARQLKRPEEEIHLLRLAALLHDIGKIGIPEAILHKPGPLTEEEWALMRQHPELGYQMLQQVGGVFGQIAQIVGTHHERWDGRGYPNGLAKEAIPMSARILAVADAYDAMISPRPYRREPLTVGEAKTELQRHAGSQHDPHVVKTFLWVLEEQENAQVLLEEAKAPGTSCQPNPNICVPLGKAGQLVAEWREEVAEWREEIAGMRQQQLALQQRIETLQQQQQYLAWRKQERGRQRQELFAAARSKQ
jgi:diguanylate cyclase (GGDEF)-like protein/putative nucleotidyltransferase with HDIG domain